MADIKVLLKRDFNDHVAGRRFRRNPAGTLIPDEYAEKLPHDAKIIEGEDAEELTDAEKADIKKAEAAAKKQEPVALSELTPKAKSAKGLSAN